MKFDSVKKWQRRICDAYIILMVTVFFLYTGDQGYVQISVDKYPLMAVISGVFLVCVLFLFLAGLLDSKHKKKYIAFHTEKINASHILLLGYLGFTLISAIASDFDIAWLGTKRFDGAVTAAIFVLVLIALSLFARPKPIHLYLLGGSTLIHCTISILQMLNKNPFGLFPEGLGNYFGSGTHYTGEYLGTLGNVDLVGAFFCVCIPAFLVYFIRKHDDKYSPILLAVACASLVTARLMWVLACVVGLAAFFVFALPTLFKCQKTLIRTLIAYGAAFATLGVSFFFVVDRANKTIAFSPSPLSVLMLAAALVCIVAFLIIYAKNIEVNIKLLKKILWIAIAAALVIGLVGIYFYPAQSGMLYEVHEILHGRAQDKFGSSRIYIWRNVLKAVPGHILLGTGPDTMGKALGLNFYRYNDAGEVTLTVSIDCAHNEYLNMLTNNGIFALVCYLGALAYAAYIWFKGQESDRKCIAGAAVLGYCAQAFFGIAQFITSAFLWLALAALLCNSEDEK